MNFTSQCHKCCMCWVFPCSLVVCSICSDWLRVGKNVLCSFCWTSVVAWRALMRVVLVTRSSVCFCVRFWCSSGCICVRKGTTSWLWSTKRSETIRWTFMLIWVCRRGLQQCIPERSISSWCYFCSCLFELCSTVQLFYTFNKPEVYLLSGFHPTACWCRKNAVGMVSLLFCLQVCPWRIFRISSR